MTDLLLDIGKSFLNFISVTSDKVKKEGDGQVLVSSTIEVGSRKGDLIVSSPAVSGKHMCFITGLMSGWCISDLGSKNGTFLIRKGGVVEQISGEFEIEKGDKIGLGSPKEVVFRVRKC